MLNSEQLEALRETSSDDSTRKICSFLLIAICDWPTLNLEQPEDYLNELEKVIVPPINSWNTVQYMNNLQPALDAWKLESLHSLFEMLNYSESIGLNDLKSVLNFLSTQVES